MSKTNAEKVAIIDAVTRGQKLVQAEMEKSYVMPLDAAYRLIGEYQKEIILLRDALLDATNNCLWRSDSSTPLSKDESQRIFDKAMHALKSKTCAGCGEHEFSCTHSTMLCAIGVKL